MIYLIQMVLMILSRPRNFLEKKPHQMDNLLAAMLVITLACALQETRMYVLAALLITPNLVLTGLKILYSTVQWVS